MTVPAFASGETAGATMAGGARAAAPIDLVHLARQTFGSQDLEREVLALFLTQARETVARIAATSGGERGALLHRLKGSARGVGARRIAALAEALEAPELGPVETTALLAGLVSAEGEARAFVEELLGLAPAGR